jgi:hypothetical protein
VKFSWMAGAALCATFGSGCELLEFLDGGSVDDGPTINIYSHQITDGEPQNIGVSCSVIGSGEGSTTSGTNEENGYWIEELTNDDGLIVRLHVGDEIADEHRYDRAFFETGALDRFVLTAPTGEEFSYSVWGANECEECPSEPYEPLPGDYLCGDDSDNTAVATDEANDNSAEATDDNFAE